jgi:hypothetical protein
LANRKAATHQRGDEQADERAAAGLRPGLNRGAAVGGAEQRLDLRGRRFRRCGGLRVSGMTGLGARSAVSSRHACEYARWGLHRSRAIGRRGTPSARRRERGEGRARANGRRRVSRRARTDAYLVRGAHDARTRLAQWSGGLGRGEQRHALFEVVFAEVAERPKV